MLLASASSIPNSNLNTIGAESLSILFFGTNQYNQPPQDIAHKFYLAQGVENFDHSKERKIFFVYRQGSSNKVTNVKFIFLNILDQEYAMCKKADAYAVFIDLESIDSLDNLSNIIAYIKDKCRHAVTTHVLGKYNSIEAKIKSLNSDNMKEYLKEKTIGFTYKEICTENEDEVVNAIRVLLEKASESQMRIKKNNGKEVNLKYNSSEVSYTNQDESNSKCILY